MPKVNRVQKQTAKVSRKRRGVLNRIEPVKLDETKGITLSLYGRSGTGKTTLACTFPKPLLLIGTEDGTRSVHNVKGVDFVQIQTTDELRILIEYLPGSKYKTVAQDTASGLQDLHLCEALGLSKLPEQGSWGMATRDTWAQVALRTKESLRAILDSLQYVIILAQEREFNIDNEGDVILPSVGSALTPSVTGWLNAHCDYIAQTFIRSKTVEKEVKVGKKRIKTLRKVRGVEYCLRTEPHEIYTTKFRAPKGHKLPDVIVDPSYQKILAVIKGD